MVRDNWTIIGLLLLGLYVIFIACAYSQAPLLAKEYGWIISLVYFIVSIFFIAYGRFRKEREREEQVTRDFRQFFEEGTDALKRIGTGVAKVPPLPFRPKFLVACSLDAPRSDMPHIRSKIRNHISTTRAFHIFHIFSESKQGKSVFIRQLLRELEYSLGDHKFQAELWFLSDFLQFSSQAEWERFIQATQRFTKLHKQQNLVLFMDNLLGLVPLGMKRNLDISEARDLFDYLKKEFGENPNITIIVTSTAKIDSYFRGEKWITHLPLHLTLGDMKRIVHKHASLHGLTNAKEFLDQPGIFGTCGRNALLLVCLYEQYNIRPRSLRHVLDEESNQALRKYDRLADAQKRRILSIIFAELLRIRIPSWLITDVEPELITRLKEPFLSYSLLSEESGGRKNIEAFFMNFLDPLIGSLCSWLGVAKEEHWEEASEILRDILHLVEEEQYRPLFTFYGHKVASGLFRDHEKPILSFVRNRLMTKSNVTPYHIREVRRWASTFSRLGLFGDADNLYDYVLKRLPNLRTSYPEVGIRITIQLAHSLTSYGSLRLRNEAIKIYHSLLFSSDARGLVLRHMILTSAASFMLKTKKASVAKRWIDQLRNSIKWDAPLWLEYGRILEVLRGPNGEIDYSGAEHCYTKAVELGRRDVSTNPRSYFNALQRYAVFLIRHSWNFKRASQKPSIEDLLREAQVVAEGIKQNLDAVFSSRGEMFAKRGKYEAALKEYRRAVNWCENQGISNPRTYASIANFISKNVAKLSGLTDLAEAERWLRTIAHRADISRYSKTQSFNILGRLVGGTVGKSKAGYRYWFNGIRRPNYDEALKCLEEAFESDIDTRFDVKLKTWQDVRNHVAVKDVLVNRAKTFATHEERCQYLRMAQKHFKAVFEGLPRDDLSDSEVQEHVIVALDAYAYFLWNVFGKEGCIGKKESQNQADYYYLEAQTLMAKWGLSAPSFQRADEIRKHYRIFKRSMR